MAKLIACAGQGVELSGVPTEIKILPLGRVHSQKGDFNVDDESFELIRKQFKDRKLDLVIDYEHQTLSDVQAPAGGWIKDLYKGEDAIIAKVEWTPKAAEYLKNKEYRYLSPVVLVDEICQRISAGTFKDLYVGDYFDISITTDLGGTETVRCILAGFDIFWNNGDTAFTKHHAVIVPKDCFKTKSVMNDTNVTTGGYVGSKMYTTVLPVYAAALQTALNNHILSHRELLTTAVSTTGNSNAGAGLTGYASNWEWKDCLVKLMSEIQVYGSTVLSSSLYDTGCDNIQFPLFRLAPNLKVAGLGHNGSRWWYWLSAVVSAAAFAYCYGDGCSYYFNAAGDGGVRPYFCIG